MWVSCFVDIFTLQTISVKGEGEGNEASHQNLSLLCGQKQKPHTTELGQLQKATVHTAGTLELPSKVHTGAKSEGTTLAPVRSGIQDFRFLKMTTVSFGVK